MDMDKKITILAAMLGVTLVLTAFNTFQTVEINRSLNGGYEAAEQPAVKRPSDYKIGIDYDKAIKGKKPIVLLFYADWCHFCIDFMPKYEALYKKFKNKYNFVKINVEDAKYEEVVKKYKINGFPMVFLVNPQKDTNIQLENQYFGDKEKMEKDLNDFYKDNK